MLISSSGLTGQLIATIDGEDYPDDGQGDVARADRVLCEVLMKSNLHWTTTGPYL